MFVLSITNTCQNPTAHGIVRSMKRATPQATAIERTLRPLLIGFGVLIVLVRLWMPLGSVGAGCCDHAAHKAALASPRAIMGADVLLTTPDTTPPAPLPAEPAYCIFCHTPSQALAAPLMISLMLLVAPLVFASTARTLLSVSVVPMTPPPRFA